MSVKKFSVLIALVAVATVALVVNVQVRDAASSPSDINIHNIQSSFNPGPGQCTVTITWDTDECTTTNIVHWGTSGCGNPSYPNSASDGAAARSHSVTIDVSSAGSRKINYYIESANACDTQTTGCRSATSGPCIGM